MIKVLFAASESSPFLKSGGLGEVIYSLAKEIRKLEIDARVILPKYSDIPMEFRKKMQKLDAFTVNVGWRKQYCGIDYMEYDGIPFYFIDNEYYFKRSGMYGYYDEAERFAFFCRGVLEALQHIDFIPDILHCHDWHTGMIAPILKEDFSIYHKIKTVFTIHNLYYQGVFPREILEDIVGLEPDFFNISGVEFYGGVSFMKGGINFSDIITTVSHNYAEEIKTPLYGEKLDEIFRVKSDILYGIENGIDYNVYDPSKDEMIFQKYDVDTLSLKTINKSKLQKELGLNEDENVPLIGIVTRLVKQKGIDLILTRIEKRMREDAQIVLLGTGEKDYEGLFDSLKDKYKGRLSVNIKFDDYLAHKIYAAADLFLMPSLFEPCGLGQMIALKYGAIPIVRETGGLKDTVTSYNELTGEGNGFLFSNYDPNELGETIDYAIRLYKNKNIWGKIMVNAMRSDNSWSKSTEKYANLYKKMMEDC